LTLQESLASAWFDFLLMALWSIAVATVSFARFLVYDPR
jgi:hypothetical protein